MVEIIIVSFSEALEESRLDPDYYRGILPKNQNLQYKKIGDKEVTTFIQYGISLGMNETGAGYKIYRMNEIEDMLCSDKVSKYVDIPQAEMQKFRLKNNDVLFNRTNSFAFVGRTGIFKEISKEDYVFASYLVRLRTNEKLVLPEYLTVFLNTKFGISEIKRRARISINQSNVSARELKKIEIPIIDMSLQEQIRDLLNNAFITLQKSKNLYHEAEVLLAEELQLLDYHFEKVLTFTAQLSELTSKRFDAEYYHPKYKETLKKVEEVAERNSWEINNIRDISEPLRYGTSEKLNYLNQGIPFLRTTDVQVFDFDPDSLCYISEQDAESLTYAKIDEGDLVISRSGTLGLTVPISKELSGSIFGSYLIRIRPKIEIDHIYLAFYLNSFLGKIQVEQNATGAVQTNLTIPAIEKIKVLIPQKEFQKKIVCLLNESKALRHIAKKILKDTKVRVEEEIEKCQLLEK
ncbi:MAG: restriction endonuclease subunit S [Candidatus Bathyarchaeota archaeon]|nr:restriction endonuclease subunit S [Candidatus Bathyarchaeota archaeon]